MVSKRGKSSPDQQTHQSDEEITVETIEPETRAQLSTNIRYDDCRAPWFSIILNLFCSLLYGYSLYFINYTPEANLIRKIFEPVLPPFGLWKFLTYHSLVMQFASSLLHLTAFIWPRTKLPRDVVFTCLAYPIGSVVVYSFWTVWLTQGREMIFPKWLESIYPDWLNHTTHTILVPINIVQAYLTVHKYIRKGSLLPFCFLLFYCGLLTYIRWRCGVFVYPYMNQIGFIPIGIYFGTILFCVVALYESGFFLTGVFHMRRIRRYTE